MLRNHLDFRKQQGLNKVTEGSKFSLGPVQLTLPQARLIKEMYPHTYHGLAKDGSPVYIERIGQLPPTFFEQISVDDFVQYFMYQSEVQSQMILSAASLAQGTLIDKVTVILDFEGLNAWTVKKVAKGLQALANLQQDNFPETLKRMLIINAPHIASWGYGLIKSRLDPEVQAKIHMTSDSGEKVLPEFIAAENIPTFWGGQCLCSGGCMHSHKGPWRDPQITRVCESVPYWEILTRIVAGEHRQLMAEYRDCVKIADGAYSEDPLLHVELLRGPSKELSQLVPLQFLAEAQVPQESLWLRVNQTQYKRRHSRISL
jgi:hypothetical protein